MLQECLSDACLDGEAAQIKEALRYHLRFSSEVGRGAIHEEVGAEVRRFAEQLSDVEGVLSDYRRVYSCLASGQDADAVTEAGSRPESKEICNEDSSPSSAPAKTPKPPSDAPGRKVPELRRFMPARNYEGRGGPAGPGEMRNQSCASPELPEWQTDMDVYAAWEVSFEMRQKLAEKLRNGVQQRRQRWWCEGEEDSPERCMRHERTEEEEPSPHKHRSRLRPQPPEEPEDESDSRADPGGASKLSTEYSFRYEHGEQRTFASARCANKPSTEYSFCYQHGEQRTPATVTPGARPSSRGPDDSGPSSRRPPQVPPRPPAPSFESSKPGGVPSPRAARFREADTRPPSASSSPKAPPPRPAGSGVRPPPPGFSGTSKPHGDSPSSASASANAWSSNQKRWGTSNWGKPGWGTSGWSKPPPTASPPKPPPAAQPPAVAAALASARTPCEQAALSSLEARLQELRRLPKEDQRRQSKELMVRWHPDKNPDRGDESTRIFQWLQNRKKELLGL